VDVARTGACIVDHGRDEFPSLLRYLTQLRGELSRIKTVVDPSSQVRFTARERQRAELGEITRLQDRDEQAHRDPSRDHLRHDDLSRFPTVPLSYRRIEP
jgi:hypothetical protein